MFAELLNNTSRPYTLSSSTMPASFRVDRENDVGLGWWDENDDQHPINRMAAVPVKQNDDQLKYSNENAPTADPVEELTTAVQQWTPLQADNSNINKNPEPVMQTALAAPITTTFQAYMYTAPVVPLLPTVPPMAATLLTGSLKGMVPTIFTGSL
ncbi:hypothetical protein EDB83DRAFT_2319185 [Lactarius deliciosus]|nr:hypothetical protein EDB83DRAFT_2319185 [Lactarius deliciosus]